MSFFFMSFLPRPLALLIPALSLVVAVAACGGGTSTGTGPDGQAASSPAAPEVNNGETPVITYVDARFHYRIDAPAHMTANADGTASVVGPSERLAVSVVQGSAASDPVAFARSDAESLHSSATSFRLLSGPTPVSINGRSVQKLVYSYNAGTSAVTGKPLDLVGVRYYIPKDSVTLAVVAYGIVSNQYDPQGADDIASTFRWQ
jgi:hypothetical protein